MLAGHLMACPEFEVAGARPLPEVEPAGLLESLPAGVLEKAREWERHVVEVQTGLPPDPPPGAVPRPGFDPAATTLAQRDRAKAAELGVGRADGAGAAGALCPAGPVGPGGSAGGPASRDEGAPMPGWWRWSATWWTPRRDSSTGTRSRLIRRAVKAVEAAYGPGVVPLPGRTTLL